MQTLQRFWKLFFQKFFPVSPKRTTVFIFDKKCRHFNVFVPMVPKWYHKAWYQDKAGTNGTNGTKMVPQSMVPRHHDTNGTTKRGANGTNGIPMVPWYQVPWYQWYHGTKYHGTINYDSIAREALRASTLGSGTLPQTPKIDHFGTLSPRCCNVRKTYYLLCFNLILEVPGPPKSHYFDT